MLVHEHGFMYAWTKTKVIIWKLKAQRGRRQWWVKNKPKMSKIILSTLEHKAEWAKKKKKKGRIFKMRWKCKPQQNADLAVIVGNVWMKIKKDGWLSWQEKKGNTELGASISSWECITRSIPSRHDQSPISLWNSTHAALCIQPGSAEDSQADESLTAGLQHRPTTPSAIRTNMSDSWYA